MTVNDEEIELILLSEIILFAFARRFGDAQLLSTRMCVVLRNNAIRLSRCCVATFV